MNSDMNEKMTQTRALNFDTMLSYHLPRSLSNQEVDLIMHIKLPQTHTLPLTIPSILLNNDHKEIV